MLSNKSHFKTASDLEGSFYKREILAIENGWGNKQSLIEKYGYSYDATTSTYRKK